MFRAVHGNRGVFRLVSRRRYHHSRDRQRDGAELPVDNIWKTDHTLVDGKDWLYERRLHYVADVPESTFLDGEVLLLTFENRSDVELEVSSITGMEHPDYPVRMEDVNQVNVRFNKAVKPETFTAQDVTLTVTNDGILTEDEYKRQMADNQEISMEK